MPELCFHIIVYSKGGDLKETPPDERSQADWESFKRAQIVDRILFTTFLSTAAATFVMIFLTDFDRNNEKSDKVANRFVLSPTVTDNGGIFVFSGSF